MIQNPPRGALVLSETFPTQTEFLRIAESSFPIAVGTKRREDESRVRVQVTPKAPPTPLNLGVCRDQREAEVATPGCVLFPLQNKSPGERAAQTRLFF